MPFGSSQRDSISVLSVTPTCPRCRKEIARDDVNVANDVAYCRPCHLAHSLAALVHGSQLDIHVDTANPPAGAWFRREGAEVTFEATHRSFVGALGALLLSLFWNGMLSVFLLVALTSTLVHLGVTLPAWYPSMRGHGSMVERSSGLPMMNGAPMGVGITIGLWLFLTPFIFVGTVLIGTFLSHVAGRTEFRIGGEDGWVSNGIGPIGRRRRFNVAAIKDVRLERSPQGAGRNSDGTQQIVIEMHDGKRLKCGTMLREDRQKFVAAVTRKLLMTERQK